MDRFSRVILLGAMLSVGLCVGLLLAVGGLVYYDLHHRDRDCCEPGRVKPEPTKPISKDALRVNCWYRPTQRIGWSWERRTWSPAGEHGPLTPGCPLYCVERRGNVAVLRGAVTGTILVPDGASARYFVMCGELGEEIGERPDPP
jgi:hypothetical protein